MFVNAVKVGCRKMAWQPPEYLLRTAISRGAKCSNAHLCDTAASAGHIKAAVCTEIGKPLIVRHEPTTPLGDGEVKVQVNYAAINFGDILKCQGKYQEKTDPPFVPGSEFGGVIQEVSRGAEKLGLRVGDRVFGSATGDGAFAEQVNTQAPLVWKIPDNADMKQAASVMVAYCTAWMALTRKAQIKKGETVLVTAAAGAVGLAAVDLAANVFQCKVIGACGGPAKGAVVKQVGAHHVIDYKTESIRDKVKEITGGQGADIIFEVVGGNVFKECLRSIAREGRLLVIGFADGEIPKIPANILLLKSCSVIGVYWGSYIMFNRAAFQESVEGVVQCLKEGKIKPYYDRIFPLDKINEAFEFILSRKSVGKVLIEV